MFEEHLQNTIALVQGNPVIGIGVAVLVVALFYFRPKDMFRLLGFCLVLVVGFYLITLLVETVGSGSKQKDEMIHRTSKAIGE
jgi:uncharacterized membrane protein YgaE (UPF0421/DUF939 family)